MAAFIFDGSTSVTASKTDTVVITANPATFTGVTESGGNVVFTFGSGQTLTITGTTFGNSTTQYPNVSLAGGVFATGAAVDAAAPVAANNSLLIGGTVETVNRAGTPTSTTAIFGGLGRGDATDGADAITFGGSGSYIAFGNAGIDTVAQNRAFDSTSFVTVFTGKGDDALDFTTSVNTKANMAIYGGEGADNLKVGNTIGGNVAIFGGQGVSDTADGGDTIAFTGGGTSTIYGTGGLDTVTVNLTELGSSTAIFGGRDADQVTVNGGGLKNTVTVYGGENVGLAVADQDVITINDNRGTTIIFGGTGAGDSADGIDTITYTGQGTAAIYGNGGDDFINVNSNGSSASAVTVFGGMGKDTITVQASGVDGTYNVSGNEGNDTFVLGNSVGQGVTISDFTVNADKLSVDNGVVGNNAPFIANGGAAATQQQALNLAAATNGGAAGTVSVVAFQGNTFVVVNRDGNTTFEAAADLAVKLTGVTDVAAVATSLVIV